jgi:hypothetical protein
MGEGEERRRGGEEERRRELEMGEWINKENIHISSK